MAEERSCKNCKRDCPFVEGYDHAPFEAHFHQIGPKTFLCVSWTDDPEEKRIETEQVGPSYHRQPREECAHHHWHADGEETVCDFCGDRQPREE